VTRHADALVRDAFGWDTVNWSCALDIWTRRTTTGPGSRALEIGAGGLNGGISLWLAAHGYDVVCSSLGVPPRRMHELHAAHGVQDAVSYQQLDILNSTHEAEFDLVVVKSVLGHVGSHGNRAMQRLAVERIHRALKPGGELWFAENAAATRLHAWGRRRLGAGRWSWGYLHLEDLPVLLEPFDERAWTTFGTAGALGRSERQRRALGRLDRVLLNRLVPARWRYVVAGTARKAVTGGAP
jgi:SAM-dependent methyltransferase